MVSRRHLLKLSALGTASFAAPLAYSASNTTMTHNTGNPIGSTSPKDLSDNARNLDYLCLGPGQSYLDRKGVPRKSWSGMENEHSADQARRECEFGEGQSTRAEMFERFMASSGYSSVGDYGAGLLIERYNQYVMKDGQPYRLSSLAAVPYTTTGNWEAESDAFVLLGDDVLRQEIADPSMGTAIVAHRSKLAGSVGRTSQDAIDEMFVSICGFGASALDSDNSPAIRKAWLEAPEGSTLLIPAAQFRIGTSLRLPSKNINIMCYGSILVGAGAWDGVVFEGGPDLTLPGTVLRPLVKGATKLSFVGTPPVTDPENYFFDIETTEVHVNRVTQDDYVAHTKSEPHSIVSFDWALSDSIIYTHNDLGLATLHLTKKAKNSVVSGLKITAEADAQTTYRNLLRNLSQSNTTFDDLEIDAFLANRFGIGLGNNKCHNLTFNRLKINGYNVTGRQGDISYPVANHLSSYIIFNNYNTIQIADPSGTKRPRAVIDHYSNQVFFKDCNFAGGFDCHIGYNYHMIGGSLTQEGFVFSGTNATMERVKCYGIGGNMALFAIRGDAPYCHGRLTIKDCEIPGEWLAVYLTTATIGDPLGRTSKFKVFDEIEIDGITVRGGLQSFNSVFNFSGVRNATVFPINEKTSRIKLRNIIAFNGMQDASQGFMRIGDADVVGAGVATLNVGEFIIDDMELPRTGRYGESSYSGDMLFGPCSIDRLEIKGSKGISAYRIRGVNAMDVVRCSTNYKAEFYFEKFNDAEVLLDGNELNIPLNVAAVSPVGEPRFTLINNIFNAIEPLRSGKIVRSQGNVVPVSKAIPPSFAGKLTNYLDATVYKTG